MSDRRPRSHEAWRKAERRWCGAAGLASRPVPGTLEKQHRCIDMPEMSITYAFGLAGWVKWVAEEDEPGGRKTVGYDMRGDTAAHRLTAEERLGNSAAAASATAR